MQLTKPRLNNISASTQKQSVVIFTTFWSMNSNTRSFLLLKMARSSSSIKQPLIGKSKACLTISKNCSADPRVSSTLNMLPTRCNYFGIVRLPLSNNLYTLHFLVQIIQTYDSSKMCQMVSCLMELSLICSRLLAGWRSTILILVNRSKKAPQSSI